MSEQKWKPASTAPRDGTWLLLRGRNMANEPMIPVVVAWKPPGSPSTGWWDSGSFKNCDSLATGDADWHPLPDESA
jgi:hypothetical protein